MTYKKMLEAELKSIEQELRSMKPVKDSRGGVVLKGGDKNTQDAYIRLVVDRLSCLKTLALIEKLDALDEKLMLINSNV